MAAKGSSISFGVIHDLQLEHRRVLMDSMRAVAT